jgi:soluble lytic murein transglycosylase-like protein
MKVLASDAWPPRFECSLVDGSTRVLTQDLAQAFKQSVRGCALLPALTVSEPAPVPPAWRPGPSAVLKGTVPSSYRSSATSPALPEEAMSLVLQASARYGLDPRWVAAVVHIESRGRSDARSPKGALGLMQVMPATGQRYGVPSAARLLDPATNLDVGARYLRDLMVMFPGRMDLTLAAYNAGEGAVIRYGNRIPPYAETQNYVRSIVERYRVLSGSSPR